MGHRLELSKAIVPYYESLPEAFMEIFTHPHEGHHSDALGLSPLARGICGLNSFPIARE